MRAKYQNLKARRGGKKALIAIAHKIVIAAFYILRDDIQFKELGIDYLNNVDKDKALNYHLKRINDLGYDVSQIKAMQKVA